ncbi:hypothetical protein D3C76_360270 [compost metagenome]
MIYECAIIGGGPAGLNAALILGRAMRSVAIIDNNRPRNAVTHASIKGNHGHGATYCSFHWPKWTA